jgi:sugar phosphate isomerase/epimerase
MANFPLSIASNSFYKMHAEGRIDLPGVLEFLFSRYRVAYADIWSGMLATLDEGYLKMIRSELDRRNLTLANLCVDGPHVWEDDQALRERHHALALQYIAAARALGARTIRIDMGCRTDELPGEAFGYICQTYLEYAKLCHEDGMRIGPENHWGASRLPENLARVHAAVNHPGYGHLLHIRNFAGDPERGYDAVLPHVMHVHVGTHGLPYAKHALKKLWKAGYSGAFSVENYTGAFELERMEWQLGAVRSIIAELEAEGPDAPESPGFISDIYSQGE